MIENTINEEELAEQRQDFFQTIHPSKKSFYVINLEHLQELYKIWTESLPNVKPHYAVKCCNNKTILESLMQLGVNFDCASPKEISTVLNICNNPSRIIYANPCKSIEDIEYAYTNSISIMTFDCKEELLKIKRHHPYAQLVLRLMVDDKGSIMQFNSKFGTEQSEVENLLQYAKDLELHVIGFSFHIGSKCQNPENYYNALRTCRNSVDIAKNMDFTINLIDIGGGFSVLDDNFKKSAIEINRGIYDFFWEDFIKGEIKFIAEPGRYFAETTHILCVSIIGKKVLHNGSKIIYTVNESIYHSFNCIMFDYAKPSFQPLEVEKYKDTPSLKSCIFGYTCDSLDKLADNVELPEMNIGDWLLVKNFGAYTYSASSQFNGFKGTEYFYYIEAGEP